jgi:hypothetical protein
VDRLPTCWNCGFELCKPETLDAEDVETHKPTILEVQMFRLFHRQSARAVTRLLLRTLDVVEDNWGLSDALWSAIELWLDADPVSCEEFLRLFREHHRDDPVIQTGAWLVGE